MNGNFYYKFLQDSKFAIEKLKSSTVESPVSDNGNSIENLDKIRTKLSFALQKSIENLDENLRKFESKYTSNANKKICWAIDYNDVLNRLHDIIIKNKIKTAYYKDNYLHKEIGLKEFLKKEKIDYSEQGAIQFIEAKMMIAETGSLLLFDNDNTVLERLNNDSIRVFIVGIEQILSSFSDVEFYKQVFTSSLNIENEINTIFYYPSSKKSNDYLFVIDNMRTNLLSHVKQRAALTCLHCDKCKQVCPVYTTIGEEPYNNVFAGPIANVILPHLESIESYKHISYACLLCGNCEKICPVLLPIKDLVLENRAYFRESKDIYISDNYKYRKYKKLLLSRTHMNRSRIFRNYLFRSILSKSFKKKRKWCTLEKSTFNQQYNNLKNDRK